MEYKEKSAVQLPHQLILQERHLLEMTGVSDVDSFDENTVTAYTTLGELTIHGKGLHIRQLNLESGSLSVEGQVDSLSYAEAVRGGGFFGRLFR
ncbi:MAG: sporulation protein YabP [Clostridia bacterium]|nr:sporulation protein YabP [Clostridia bacterium]